MDAAAAIAMSVVAHKTRLMFDRMRGHGQAPAASREGGEATHPPGAT